MSSTPSINHPRKSVQQNVQNNIQPSHTGKPADCKFWTMWCIASNWVIRIPDRCLLWEKVRGVLRQCPASSEERPSKIGALLQDCSWCRNWTEYQVCLHVKLQWLALRCIYVPYRRVELERRLQGETLMSEERKHRQLSNLGKKESMFLRLRRTKFGLDDFRTIKVIGKGAFGEVSFSSLVKHLNAPVWNISI